MAQELVLVLKTDEEKAVCKYALEKLRRDLSKVKNDSRTDGYKDVCDDLLSRVGTVAEAPAVKADANPTDSAEYDRE